MNDETITQAAPRPMLLTTTDNPYNPFTQWKEWLSFDLGKGYNTNSLLARVVVTTDELGDEFSYKDIVVAMNEIVSENLSGVHTMVTVNGTLRT